MIPSIPSLISTLYSNRHYQNEQLQKKKRMNLKYCQLNIKKLDDKKKNLSINHCLYLEDSLVFLTQFPINDALELMRIPKKSIEEGEDNSGKSYKTDLISSNKHLAISISLKRLKEIKKIRVFIEKINIIFKSEPKDSQIDGEILESILFVLSNQDFIFEINAIIPSKSEMESIKNKLNQENSLLQIEKDDDVFTWLVSLSQIKDVKEIFNLLETVLSTENMKNDIKKWVSQIENNVKYIENCKIIKSFMFIVSLINEVSCMTEGETENIHFLLGNKSISEYLMYLIDFTDGVKKVVSYKQSKKLFRLIASYISSSYTQDSFPSLSLIDKLVQDMTYIQYIPKIHIEFNQIENSLFNINVLLQNRKSLLNILNIHLLSKAEHQLKEIYLCLDTLSLTRNRLLDYFFIKIELLTTSADESFMNRSEIESILSIRSSNWMKFKSCYDSVILLYKELSMLYKSLSFKEKVNLKEEEEEKPKTCLVEEEKEKKNGRKVNISHEDKENDSKNLNSNKEKGSLRIKEKLGKIKKIDYSKSIKNLHISSKY